MKDRILNILMLLAVAAALVLTLMRGAPDSSGGALPLPVAAAVTPVPAASPHPAETYRTERASTRAREEALLLALIESAQTAPETRALAEEQLLALTENGETELAVEAALAARGYENALCAARRGSLTVFFPREISAREAALFLEIAREASGLPAENIRLTGF